MSKTYKRYSRDTDIVGGIGLVIIFIALGITLTKACDKACDNVTLVTPNQQQQKQESKL